MTVPGKYVTLSNGHLAAQKNNANGTRTDTWKMELPHSPYLFMMAVGDFKIHKDSWHGKEVSYYLEPKYAPYAKDNFGLVPEAIDFFSKTLGLTSPGTNMRKWWSVIMWVGRWKTQPLPYLAQHLPKENLWIATIIRVLNMNCFTSGLATL